MNDEVKRLSVSVNSGDISVGEPNDGQYCPIALALNRRLDSRYVAAVNDEQVHIYPAGTLDEIREPDDWDSARFKDIDRILLPPKAGDFVRAFDGGDPVRPFRFSIPMREDYLKKDEITPDPGGEAQSADAPTAEST